MSLLFLDYITQQFTALPFAGAGTADIMLKDTVELIGQNINKFIT